VTEAELDREVRRLIRARGLWGFHPFDSRRSAPGWPDWTIVGRRIIYRELKSSTGDLTPHQRRVGYLIQATGADWAVWRPTDLRSGRIGRELAELAG
jgi:hypothetical protein